MFTSKKNFIVPLLLVLLFLSLACATSIPFLDTNSPEAAPTEIDPFAIETMIANAVEQKVAETLAAIPPTKIPTATVINTATPLPTATEIPPTLTPTEIVFEGSGNEITENENDSLLYIDFIGGYQVNLPPNWMALRPSSTEYDEAWLLPEASVPEIGASLEAMRNLDANIFRLFLLDTQEGHYSNGFVNNINFVLDTESEASLEEAFAQSVLALPEAISGLILTTANLSETAQGLPVGLISSEWDAAENLRIYQQQAVFIVNNNPLVITLSSSAEFEAQTADIFKIMVDNFTLTE